MEQGWLQEALAHASRDQKALREFKRAMGVLRETPEDLEETVTTTNVTDANYLQVQFPAQLGWECPRCHTVYAPQVTSCGCSSMPPVPATLPLPGGMWPWPKQFPWHRWGDYPVTVCF